MRPIVYAAIVVALAAAGCTNTGIDKGKHLPQNEGANADVKGVLHLRNAFLLGSANPASPSAQKPLYAVLINNSAKPDQLQKITVDGGGNVQLAGALNLPPSQAVGTGNRPIGSVTGVNKQYVPMTFTFRDAGPVHVTVPVKPAVGQFASIAPSPAGSPTPAHE
jgi:copper(I)-binding protein